MKILISACLLGLPCRYDGVGKACEKILALKDKHTLIPVCPEQLGGLQTPRAPSEIVGERVLSCNGQDNTEAFGRGADCALTVYQTLQCELAILRSHSPSCGAAEVYDGTFTGRLVKGRGVTAKRLMDAGVQVLNEDDPRLDSILQGLG